MILDINTNQDPARDTDRTCPNCDSSYIETIGDGCDCCKFVCDLYDEVRDIDESNRVLVKVWQGSQVIWKRGVICNEALIDEDYSDYWKPNPTEVTDSIFDELSKTFKPNKI